MAQACACDAQGLVRGRDPKSVDQEGEVAAVLLDAHGGGLHRLQVLGARNRDPHRERHRTWGASGPSDPPDAVLARLDDIPAVAWKAPITDALRPVYDAVARSR